MKKSKLAAFKNKEILKPQVILGGNKKNEWVCEDRCVERKEETQYCGKTDHL